MREVTLQNAAEVAKDVKANQKPAGSLAEAVCRVMAEVAYVQKDKQMMGGGSYKYVSVEAVIDVLRPEMIRQQLILLPSAVEPLNLETFEGKNGGRQNRTQVKYTFRLIHAPTAQTEEVVVIGEAIDVGDKSSNKAMTAARKYALIMAFNLETGVDPDDTPSRSQERAAPAAGVTPWAKTIADKLKAALTRDVGVDLWKEFDAEAKAGRVTAEDRKALDAAFADFGKRFPSPAKPQTAKG